MIKYQYALNEANNLVSINDVTPKQSDIFICISCNNVLIPKLGKIRKKHFSHKAQYNCSPETYLHKLGKRIFIDVYTRCINEGKPFLIELPEQQICNKFEGKFGKTCNLPKKVKDFDLTKYFKNILEEQIDGNFKPDIQLLGNNNEKIYIEIAVSHKVTNEKISSGIKIIEINISQEDDLSIIISRKLLHKHEKIKFYNFKELVSKNNHCNQNECDNTFQAFVLFKSSNSALVDISLSHLNKLVNSDSVDFYKFTKSHLPENELFKSELINAFNNGYKVKNCFLCRYHAKNNSFYDRKNPIFCKFIKKSFGSNYASECDYYKPDNKCFPEVILDKY